jgi:hypothetical protein
LLFHCSSVFKFQLGCRGGGIVTGSPEKYFLGATLQAGYHEPAVQDCRGTTTIPRSQLNASCNRFVDFFERDCFLFKRNFFNLVPVPGYFFFVMKKGMIEILTDDFFDFIKRQNQVGFSFFVNQLPQWIVFTHGRLFQQRLPYSLRCPKGTLQFLFCLFAPDCATPLAG